jgi:hypothetical protein
VISQGVVATQGHNSDGHSVMSLGVVATKGHNSDKHSMISPGAVATKGHNNDISTFSISPTSLTESRTHLHKYFLISSALRRWFS